jgi:dTDP-4-amino-4,6-dideoxygalactose transaminase
LKRYISGKPTFYLKQVLPKGREKLSVFPLSQNRWYYFFSSRYALAAGIKALGIDPNGTILLPSYNCGAEIDPILHLGLRPVFYNINKKLVVDFEDLFRKITRGVKAILVTHFLGFPEPINEIKKICVERNLFLIEDCAHALLSTHNGKPLGSYGDVSIFSLLKTLPVPNGGVLLINNMNICHNYYPERPNFFATCFYAAELLKYKTIGNNNAIKENGLNLLYDGVYLSLSSFRLMLAGFRKYFNPKGLYLVKPDSYLFIKDLCSWGISDLSKKIINKTDFEEIKIVRRRNFEYLLNHFLKNVRAILPFKDLPVGVCPLFFPLILESAEQREKLYRTLKRRGVITYPWWDRFHPEVPWDEFPDAVYLKKRLFGLPIHQDLTLKHLDLMIEEFENAYKSREK